MKRALLIFAVTLLASCSPQLREAQVDIPTEYQYESGLGSSSEALGERWWQSFGDPTLNSLVERSLRNNRDLRATATSVEQARHLLRVARAEYLPSLSMEGIAELTHEEGVTEQEYTIAPTLEWEISLFGALRNTKRAAAASLLEEEWNLRGVILSLTTEVAKSYYSLLQYERSLYIATRSYELRLQATALVDSIYRYGMGNGTDLMQAKSLVYSAKIEMERYKRAVATASLSLGTLLGENPQPIDFQARGSALLSDRLPLEIPIGLPSSLLERRPDVMKSYYAMVNAAAKVGVSRANRYPTISLTGSSGVFATSLKGLTSGNPLLWSGTAEIVAPLFSWGALKGKELIAREEYTSCVAEYEQSFIEALSDVEQALVAIDTYRDETELTAALVIANGKIAQNSTALYSTGLGDYLSVIDAERELYSSQISMVDVVAQQYINYIDLFKALGGGW